MKKIGILAAFLLVFNIVLFASSVKKQKLQTVFRTSSVKCFAGGPNASQCSIDAGIELDAGVSYACSVTCKGDTYACCHLGCKCYPNEKEEMRPYD